MPVRWNSTYIMLKASLKMKVLIKAIYTTQEIDKSVRAISLTDRD